jgi:site-specific DNA recombinase
LNLLPVTSRDLTTLPEDIQRQLYDAFHLQIRYHHTQRRVTIQVTLSAANAPDLAQRITAATDGAPTIRVHVVSTPGGS